MKEKEEEEDELWCIGGRRVPAALLLCCLAHPASGRQPITAQGSSATSVQCVRANRGGRQGVDTEM